MMIKQCHIIYSILNYLNLQNMYKIIICMLQCYAISSNDFRIQDT